MSDKAELRKSVIRTLVGASRVMNEASKAVLSEVSALAGELRRTATDPLSKEDAEKLRLATAELLEGTARLIQTMQGANDQLVELVEKMADRMSKETGPDAVEKQD